VIVSFFATLRGRSDPCTATWQLTADGWHPTTRSRIIRRMKNSILALALCTLIGAGSAAAKTDIATGTGIGQRLPQFTTQIIDVSAAKPKTLEFDSHKTQHPTVYIFVGTHCPATGAYAERLTQLEMAYKPKGIDFIYIYPNREDTSEAKVAFHGEKKFTGRLIDDQGAKLARLFNAQRTSELFLVDKDGVIVYHGAIDDSRDPGAVKEHYLADALDQLLAGKPITTASSQVFA
jgi:thiol-disulfide isomerase/thioredoxin